MKNKLVILLAVILLHQSQLSAQSNDSLKNLYKSQTIYRFGSHFMKGIERLDFDDLEGEFYFSELGQINYERAKKLRTIGKIFRYVSLLSSVAIAPFIGHNNKNGAYIFLGINIGLGAGASLYSNLSGQSLDRALWQRNKDLLFPEQQ